jgi:heme oxygenase
MYFGNNLVPIEFDVPQDLKMEEFHLRVLTVNDVVKDYDAVMSSAAHLKTVWPGGDWPEGLTLEQDLIDLGWHQKEFQLRRSFAYSVVTPSESKVMGCVYIYPSDKLGYEAEIYLWARQSELAAGLEDRLYSIVRKWLTDSWPFKRVAFPGRDISLEAWLQTPSKNL